MYHTAQQANWQGIMDQFLHFHPAFRRPKAVFVVPEPVGNGSIFVHKTDKSLCLSEFRNPVKA